MPSPRLIPLLPVKGGPRRAMAEAIHATDCREARPPHSYADHPEHTVGDYLDAADDVIGFMVDMEKHRALDIDAPDIERTLAAGLHHNCRRKTPFTHHLDECDEVMRQSLYPDAEELADELQGHFERYRALASQAN